MTSRKAHPALHTQPDIAERVERWLDDISMVDETRHHLLQALRAIIKEAGASSEEVKYGGLLYSASHPFCGLFSYSAHVSLEFSQGAVLPDPEGLLLGGGKFRRHFKVRGIEDLQTLPIAQYVQAACAMAMP